MDKSEKIKRIKELQSQIADLVKQQQFDQALEKMDEILNIAPNLQKIKDLKAKIEKKAALMKAKSSKEESGQKAEEKDTQSKEVQEPSTEPVEDSSKESLEHMQALLEQGQDKVEGKPEPEAEAKESTEPTPPEIVVKEITEVTEKESAPVSEEKKLKEVEEILKEEMSKEEADEELENLLGEQEKIKDILKEPPVQPTQEKQETLDDLDLDALLDETEPSVDTVEKPTVSESQSPEEEENSLKPDIDFSKIMDQAMEEEPVAKMQEPDFSVSGDTLKLDTEPETETEPQPSPVETTSGERVLTKEEADRRLQEALKKQERKDNEPEKKDEMRSEPAYKVDYSTGVPTVRGGKKKEKLDYDFKISDEPEIKGGHETVSSPYAQMGKPSLEKTFDIASRKGFSLSLIPQAMGFAFNLERMLYLTLGIFLSVVIGKFIMMILPAQYGLPLSTLISSSIYTFFLTFISYTIVLQMKQHVHGNFRQFFPTFANQFGSSAISYWFIYSISLILVSLAAGILLALLKFGNVGAVLYGLLSLPSLIFIVIFVLLLFASPLLSFIVPALIAIDKPGPLETFYESIRLLKNHLFTILGGFLYSIFLSFFLVIILFFVYTFSAILLFTGGFLIGGGSFMKLIQGIPPSFFQPVGMISGILHLPFQIPVGMAPAGEQSVASFLFMIMLFIGVLFLFTIPVIFINGSSVITYMTLKEKLDIHKDE